MGAPDGAARATEADLKDPAKVRNLMTRLVNHTRR